MELGKEYFGPLWSFVASNEITDIDYNGKEIWLTNIFNERFRANQQFVTQYMTPAFVEQFTQRIANVVSRQFNKRNPRAASCICQECPYCTAYSGHIRACINPFCHPLTRALSHSSR